MATPKTKRFTWSKHPEESDWMARYCKGHSIQQSIDAFEKKFGIRLTKGQVLGFRERQGIRNYSKRQKKAIGEEMIRGGYVYVKVATDLSEMRNWRPKGVIEWERANGRPLPDGHKVMFLDGDRTNFDPENLVAVDKKKAAVLAQLIGKGIRWSSREEFDTMLAIGELEKAVTDAKNRPKTCRVCGATFVPDHRYNQQESCRACLDSGKRASSWENRTPVGRGFCVKCGREFDKFFHYQKRCSECSSRKSGRKRYQAWKGKRGL